MSLNSKLLMEILNNTEKLFICLRCGECCYRWAVTFKRGHKKNENEKCPYLNDIKIENGRWKEASCKIYKNRPKQCKNFKLSFATICPIGLWKWLKILENNENIELPNKVKTIFDFLKYHSQN
ncbi:MAG: YkgJ family cysteine cluster protein [Thermodesulfovibrio sp.]|nr:YkgJ family cysteine cluster protein [Thermodesulfovibrio sp.]